MSIKYYSQLVNGHLTDIFLLKNFLNKKNCNGIFLELGACDGIRHSNTYALEQYLNFTGVLIEPGKIDFSNLIKNRPNCKNFNCLVGVEEGKVDYIGDRTSVGGPLKLLENTKKQNEKNWIEAWNLNKGDIQKVHCRKLSDILHEANIKYIDFWSLDVEGSELEVLKTMDWNIPVYIICMEVTAWGKAGQDRVEECRNILRSNGFTCDGKKYGLDEYWINNNYFRKDMLYSK